MAGYKCEQCKDTGFAISKKADGSIERVLCYCHPLVKSGKIKPLSGSTAIGKYIDEQIKKKR